MESADGNLVIMLLYSCVAFCHKTANINWVSNRQSKETNRLIRGAGHWAQKTEVASTCLRRLQRGSTGRIWMDATQSRTGPFSFWKMTFILSLRVAVFAPPRSLSNLVGQRVTWNSFFRRHRAEMVTRMPVVCTKWSTSTSTEEPKGLTGYRHVSVFLLAGGCRSSSGRTQMIPFQNCWSSSLKTFFIASSGH